MISTLLDWVARPGIGAVTVAVTVWAARRLRGSERLRTILSRVIGAAIHEAVTQVVLPPVADRLSSIDTRLASIEARLALLEVS